MKYTSTGFSFDAEARSKSFPVVSFPANCGAGLPGSIMSCVGAHATNAASAAKTFALIPKEYVPCVVLFPG